MNGDTLKQLFLAYYGREPNRDEYCLYLEGTPGEFATKHFGSFNNYLNNSNIQRIMNGKPKIAVLLSGHIRNLNITPRLLDIAVENNIDVFAFAWDNQGIKGNETNIEDLSDKELTKSRLLEIPKLVQYKIENNKDWIIANPIKDDVVYFNYSSPEIYIKSQLYAIMQSYKLMEDYIKKTGTQYSLVIKARYDMTFEHFDPADHMLEDINNNKIIFTPNDTCGHSHPDHNSSCMVCDIMYHKHGLKKVHIFDHASIICDTFAYGSVKSMYDYCHLYDHYDDLARKYYDINIESLRTTNIAYSVKDNNTYQIEMNKANDMLSSYYLYCSYPERMLQIHLKDYMLVASKNITMRFHR